MSARANFLALAYAAATAASIGFWGVTPYTLLIPAALFLAIFIDGIARPTSSLLYPTISHGPRSGQRVALTFDDGPDPQVTPFVLDTLARHGARATFFGIGRAVQAHADLAQRVVQEGHELGNHSWRHSRWQNFFGARRQSEEIERGARAVTAVSAPSAAGTRGAAATETCARNGSSASAAASSARTLYRPPMGLKSPPFARAAWRQRLQVIAWSINSRDTFIRDPERVARRVLRKIRPGDIVLMHDGHDLPGRHRPGCAAAVALILDGLRQKQLQCVTVSELLAATPAAQEISI